MNLAAQDVPELGIGSGLSTIEVGLRLGYEFRREIAPYFGIDYVRALGDTADFVRDDGGDVDSFSIVAGLRFWF